MKTLTKETLANYVFFRHLENTQGAPRGERGAFFVETRFQCFHNANATAMSAPMLANVIAAPALDCTATDADFVPVVGAFVAGVTPVLPDAVVLDAVVLDAVVLETPDTVDTVDAAVGIGRNASHAPAVVMAMLSHL
jgi:hypothetical protein